MDDGKNPQWKAFGAFLKAARTSYRDGEGSTMPVRRLASLIGMSHSYLVDAENGLVKPLQPTKLQLISEHLGMSYTELLKMAGRQNDDVVEAVEASESLAGLARAAMGLPDASVDAVAGGLSAPDGVLETVALQIAKDPAGNPAHYAKLAAGIEEGLAGRRVIRI